MAFATIDFNGTDLQVVQLPWEVYPQREWEEHLTFSHVEFNIEDAISAPSNPYTGISPNVFEWPGAEKFYGTCELPSLTQAQAAPWRAFLMQCRGMLHPFLLGDASQKCLLGTIDGTSKPVCNTANVAADNLAMSKLLKIRGLRPGTARLMLAGEPLQVGYRLHFLADDLKSAADGTATVEVWPSLREQPLDGTAIVVNQPRGLFCLATNKRTWSSDFTRLSHMSVPIMEWRRMLNAEAD